eukprot:318314-Pyramimonas_sp.AAC.1
MQGHFFRACELIGYPSVLPLLADKPARLAGRAVAAVLTRIAVAEIRGRALRVQPPQKLPDLSAPGHAR